MKSIPTLHAEWKRAKEAADKSETKWRKALLAKDPDAENLKREMRAREQLMDIAARRLSNACLDSRGAWTWSGDAAPPIHIGPRSTEKPSRGRARAPRESLAAGTGMRARR